MFSQKTSNENHDRGIPTLWDRIGFKQIYPSYALLLSCLMIGCPTWSNYKKGALKGMPVLILNSYSSFHFYMLTYLWRKNGLKRESKITLIWDSFFKLCLIPFWLCFFWGQARKIAPIIWNRDFYVEFGEAAKKKIKVLNPKIRTDVLLLGFSLTFVICLIKLAKHVFNIREKTRVVSNHGRLLNLHNDTGSPESQIALFTPRESSIWQNIW